MNAKERAPGISFSVVLAGGVAVFMIMVIMVVGMPGMFYTNTPTERAHEYSELEARGRHLYIIYGCFYCHSQQVRPSDWGLGIKSESGDFVYDSPHTLGTERSGPDLAQFGGSRPVIWDMRHHQHPRDLSPGSIMPDFNFLSEDDLNALTAYISAEGGENLETQSFQLNVPEGYVGLQNPFQPLVQNASSYYNSVNQTYYGDPTLGAEYAALFQEGKLLFTDKCLSCHGGSGIGQGPYARHVVTRPANLNERIKNYPSIDFHFFRVSEGVPGTSMPSWVLSLNETERWVIVTYEQTFNGNGTVRTISGDISDQEGDVFNSTTGITPPIAGTKEDFNTGKEVFLLYCAQCHGVDGQGDGPASNMSFGGYVNPTPANLTESGNDFADFNTYGRYVWKIKEGVETTNMPIWKLALGDDYIFRVIFYIQGFAPADKYNAVWGPMYTDPFGRNLKANVNTTAAVINLQAEKISSDTGSDRDGSLVLYDRFDAVGEAMITKSIALNDWLDTREAEVLVIVLPSLAIGLVFLGYLLWGVRTGQFKDIEESKNLPLEKEDEGI